MTWKFLFDENLILLKSYNSPKKIQEVFTGSLIMMLMLRLREFIPMPHIPARWPGITLMTGDSDLRKMSRAIARIMPGMYQEIFLVPIPATTQP